MLLCTCRSTRALEKAGSSDGGSAFRLMVIDDVPWEVLAAGALGAAPPQAASASANNATAASHKRARRSFDAIVSSFQRRIGRICTTASVSSARYGRYAGHASLLQGRPA